MRQLLFMIIPLLLTISALAEYRVFQLQILTYQPDGLTVAETQSFPHTLDPEQYRGYFPVRPNQKIQYTDTWLCPGRTSHHKPFCPNPRAISTTEGQDLQ
jgi:hypothetical protein